MGQVLQGQGVGVEGPWVEGAMRTQAEEPPPPVGGSAPGRGLCLLDPQLQEWRPSGDGFSAGLNGTSRLSLSFKWGLGEGRRRRPGGGPNCPAPILLPQDRKIGW